MDDMPDFVSEYDLRAPRPTRASSTSSSVITTIPDGNANALAPDSSP